MASNPPPTPPSGYGYTPGGILVPNKYLTPKVPSLGRQLVSSGRTGLIAGIAGLATWGVVEGGKYLVNKGIEKGPEMGKKAMDKLQSMEMPKDGPDISDPWN